MKNKEDWQASKFVFKNNRLIGSRDSREVGVASRLMADTVAAHYATYLKKYAKGKLVDLGCGKVPLYVAYRDLVIDTTCVDWPHSIHTNPYLDVECNLNEPLPFANEVFDTVILSDVLEHLNNPVLIWKEMSRILSKAGHVIMNVPFYYGIHEAPHDYFRYTEYALRQFAESSGFNVVLLKTTGGVPEILADILSKNISRVPGIGTFFTLIVQKSCSLFMKTSFGKRISNKTGKTFPFGYFLVAEKL